MCMAGSTHGKLCMNWIVGEHAKEYLKSGCVFMDMALNMNSYEIVHGWKAWHGCKHLLESINTRSEIIVMVFLPTTFFEGYA